MITVNPFIKTLVSGLMLIFSLPILAITDSGETVTLQGSINDDYYAAASTIDMDADVAGDVTIAGGELYIGKLIQGDLIAAGGKVRFRGKVQDDVRLAGGDIDIEAEVGDDLIASGGNIRIASSTTVGGDAWLAGGEVRMAGTVNRDLVVVAGHVSLSGIVHGNVEIKAGEIEILDGARIDGNLTYSSPVEAANLSRTVIGGEVIFQQAEWGDSARGFGFFFSITLIVASIVMLKLFPHFTLSSAARISSDPWLSLGLGFALLVITPLVSLLLISIVLGVWVGLSMLALYFVFLLAGFLISLFFIGERGAKLINKELNTAVRRILSVVLATILLAFITRVPVIGCLLIFALLLSGSGAAILQVKLYYSESA